MTKKKEYTLMAMCWLLYVSAYLGRYSYNSNIVPISSFYQVSNTEVSMAMTFFFFAYGAGQIINGLFCKFYNLKYVLSGALIISALINGSVFIGVPFKYVKYLWLLNGVSQSFLWSSLLLILSRNLSGQSIKKSVVVMSTTASIGKLLTYGLSALLAIFNGFRFSFLIASIIMIFSGILWISIYGFMTEKEKTEEKQEIDEKESLSVVKTKSRVNPTVVYTLIVFGIFAVIVNLVMEGLGSWVPKILKDSYKLSDSLSIFLTLFLPILSVFGTAFIVALNKKIKEYTLLISIVFFAVALLVALVMILLGLPYWALILIVFGLISLLMNGANNIVTSMIPLSLRDKANSGFVGGILNGCCYVGSTLSSVCMGVLSDKYGGWTAVFVLMLILCSAVFLIGLVCTIIRFSKERKTAK